MLKNDNYLFTSVSPTNGRKASRRQDLPMKNSNEPFTDMAKTFNGFANKIYGLRSHALNTPQSKDTSRNIHEPKTPDEQLFAFPDTSTPPSSIRNFNPPGLTPDSLFSGVSPQKVPSASPVTPRMTSHAQILASRKPVPTLTHLESVPPLQLRGLSIKLNRNAPHKLDNLSASSNKPSPAQRKTCVFCDMALDSKFISETISRLPCGHAAHCNCLNGILKVCEQYGEKPPSCTICNIPVNGSTFSSDSAVPFTHRSDRSASIKSTKFTGIPDFSSLKSASSINTNATDNSLEENHLETTGPLESVSFKENVTPQPIPVKGSGAGLGKETQIPGLNIPFNGYSGLETLHSPPYEIPVFIEDQKGCSETSQSMGAQQIQQPHLAPTTASVNSVSSPSSVLSEAISIPLSPHSNSSRSLYHHAVGKIFESATICHKDSRTRSKFSLKMAADLKRCEDKVQVAICLQVADLRCPRKNSMCYHTSAKDIQTAIEIKKSLDNFNFKGRQISSLQLGLPRLASKVYVTSPLKHQLVWEDCDAYLFDTTLILITELKRVRAVLQYRQAIRSANLHPEDSTTVRLTFTTKELPPLDLQMLSRASAFSWVQALSNPKCQYPLCLENWLQYAENLETELDLNGEQWPFSHRYAATDIILCMPYHLISESLEFQKKMFETLDKLDCNTQIAVVLYSKTKQILESTNLQSPFWKGWKSTFKMRKDFPNIGKSTACPQVTGKYHDCIDGGNNLLEEVGAVLKNRKNVDVLGSVILVSDDNTNYNGGSSNFESLGVPIHTIAFSNSADIQMMSTLAKRSDGMFSFANSATDLAQILGGLFNVETKYVIQDATVTLRSRIGAKIDYVRKTYIDSAKTPVTSDDETRSVEWKLGRMHMGDYKSVILEIKGDIPPNQPLLQISVDANYMPYGKLLNSLGTNGNLNTQDIYQNSAVVRLDAPAYKSELDIETRTTLFDTEILIGTVLDSLEASIFGLSIENTRKSFEPLVAGLDKIRHLQAQAQAQSQSPPSASLEKSNEIIREYLDHNCDGVIERLQGFDYYLTDFIKKIWVLGTRRSLLVHDDVDEIFFTNS